MKKLGINTISNIATKLWSMVSIYLFIPLYIRILGETSYGLVSFFATMQTTLNILGLGLSNTLRREFASGENTEKNAVRKYMLLRSVENIYFVIAAMISFLCVFGSPVIAEQWLQIETLDPRMVTIVIFIMGISIAFQLVANLYAGCLFGLEYQVDANIICILWSAAKSIGALAVIWMLSPNLIYFYCWHIFTDAIYFWVLRYYSIKKLDIKTKVKWRMNNFSNIKSVWKYTCGILCISFVALINKQLDKVIISKFLPITELGAYNIATTLGSLSTIIPIALYTTVFPRFTHYATTNNRLRLEKEFLKINKAVGLILSSMGAFIAVYALPLIRVWTGSEAYVEILGFVGTLVVLAVAITEYQEIPYALALANGNTKYNVIVGGIFIPFVFFATYIGIVKYGLVGAGMVYLVTMTAQTLIYEWMVYHKYLKVNPVRVILTDMILPLSLSLFIAFTSKYMIELRTLTPLAESGLAVVFGGLTLVVLFIVFMRKDMVYLLKKGKGEEQECCH